MKHDSTARDLRITTVDPTSYESEAALVRAHLPEVPKIARMLIVRYRLPFKLKEDLVAAGQLGLIEAARTYSFEGGATFRTFSFYRIRGAMLDELASQQGISLHTYRRFRALAAAHELGTGRGTTDPAGFGLTRLCEYLSNAALAFQLTECQRVDSGAPDRLLEDHQRARHLRETVKRLPARERTVIEEYYLAGRTFHDIALHDLRCTKGAISKLHRRAIGRLRTLMIKDHELP